VKDNCDYAVLKINIMEKWPRDFNKLAVSFWGSRPLCPETLKNMGFMNHPLKEGNIYESFEFKAGA
jgi:hypothetical protein